MNVYKFAFTLKEKVQRNNEKKLAKKVWKNHPNEDAKKTERKMKNKIKSITMNWAKININQNIHTQNCKCVFVSFQSKNMAIDVIGQDFLFYQYGQVLGRYIHLKRVHVNRAQSSDVLTSVKIQLYWSWCVCKCFVSRNI